MTGDLDKEEGVGGNVHIRTGNIFVMVYKFL